MVFTIIDIETTGLSKNHHKITEIAAARFRNGKLVRSFQTLVNPEVKIPSFITRLTGIDNELVKDAQTIDKALPKFIRFLSDDVFVAHNATFDYGFLEQNIMMHHKRGLLNERLCTRKLANRLFPDLPRKRLCDLCEHLNIKNIRAHRAMADVKATAEVFRNMLNQLDDIGISEVQDIIRFEKSPIQRNIIQCRR